MSWLFQSIPRRYNLKDKMQAGESETWLVTRYMDEMKKGDLVFLWMAGPPEIRGLYGWGRVSDDKPRFFKDWGYGIAVRYERKFRDHILFSEVKALWAFSDFVLFKTAIGTNFKLSDEQTEALTDLIRRTFSDGEAP